MSVSIKLNSREKSCFLDEILSNLIEAFLQKTTVDISTFLRIITNLRELSICSYFIKILPRAYEIILMRKIAPFFHKISYKVHRHCNDFAKNKANHIIIYRFSCIL